MARKSNYFNDHPCFGIGDIERYSKDKKTIADNNVMQVLTKMQSAFKWKGLPDTIPAKWLEFQLDTNGWCFFTKVKDEYYTFTGGLGGEPDAYYQPTICTIANPALNFSGELEIGKDGVLISNDTYRRGVIPVIGKYAGLLAENTITIRIADIMSRLTNIMSAADDDTIESAKEYLRQIEEGNLGVIEESPFLEDLKVQAAATTGNTRLTDLIEMEQYLKASLYNELGLQANYNMKRESINSSEAQLGDDVLQPMIDNMLAMRQNACEEINKMYGLEISVELDSAWKDNEETRGAELEAIEAEGEGNGNSQQSDDDNSVPGTGDSNGTEEDKDGQVVDGPDGN